jgi:tetratricopeptide (TPR) repeat protein
MIAEVKALDEEEPYFFASHPRLKERVASFRKLTADSDGKVGKKGGRRFLQATAGVRMDALKIDIDRRRYRSVLLTLEDKEKMSQYPPQANFYLGEAYRLRGGDHDYEKAEAAYKTAVKGAPSFAPSYKALGLLQMKKKMNSKALTYFQRYLALMPDAPDASYIQSYIKQIGSGR